MAELCFNTFNHSAWYGVDADLPGQLVAAADAGFRWWGPDVFSLNAWVASGHAVIELAEMLHAHNMSCWEITALNITDPGETLREAHHIAELAAVLRPKWVLTNVGAPSTTACATPSRRSATCWPKSASVLPSNTSPSRRRTPSPPPGC